MQIYIQTYHVAWHCFKFSKQYLCSILFPATHVLYVTSHYTPLLVHAFNSGFLNSTRKVSRAFGNEILNQKILIL